MYGKEFDVLLQNVRLALSLRVRVEHKFHYTYFPAKIIWLAALLTKTELTGPGRVLLNGDQD
jgi:hypothetical protein